jgi:hypothetical protein
MLRTLTPTPSQGEREKSQVNNLRYYAAFAAAHCGKPAAFRRDAYLETGGEAQPRRRIENGCCGKAEPAEPYRSVLRRSRVESIHSDHV